MEKTSENPSVCMMSLELLATKISEWICQNGVDNFHLSKLKPFLEEYEGGDCSPCTKSSIITYCRHKQKFEIEHCCQVFDIFVLTWRSKGASPVHNHAKTGCIYKVVHGELQEELYDPSKNIKIPTKVTNLKKGECGYIDDETGFHRIWNPTDESSVSIHIYETGYKPECFKCYDVPEIEK